jgi:hypothetical protein
MVQEVRVRLGWFATRLRREYGAAQQPVSRPDFLAGDAIFRASLPESCHDRGMGQLLSHSPAFPRRAGSPAPRRAPEDRGAAARGILLALGLSSLVWIGLALAVPRLW